MIAGSSPSDEDVRGEEIEELKRRKRASELAGRS